jgi:hypothetical protein
MIRRHVQLIPKKMQRDAVADDGAAIRCSERNRFRLSRLVLKLFGGA